jgi:hypothetical protein
MVVASPAPSRDRLSARTAPVARRLTPTLKPTLSERGLTSKTPFALQPGQRRSQRLVR